MGILQNNENARNDQTQHTKGALLKHRTTPNSPTRIISHHMSGPRFDDSAYSEALLKRAG